MRSPRLHRIREHRAPIAVAFVATPIFASANRSVLRPAVASLAALILAAGIVAEARASTPSYWGAMPAPADSVTAVFTRGPDPLWEKAVLAPYRVVTFPVKLAAAGLGAVVVFVDESPRVASLRRVLAPRIGDWEVGWQVSAGGRDGVGGGLTLGHRSLLGEDNRLKIQTQVSTEGANRAVIGLRLGASATNRFEIGLGYRVQPHARFHGLGPDASKDAYSYYKQDMRWLGVSWDRRLAAGVDLESSTVVTGVGAHTAGGDERPYLPVRFPEPPAGFGERVDGFTLGLALRRDTTGETGRPESGSVGRLMVARYLGLDEVSDAWIGRADLQTFVPLWHTQRALALRGMIASIEPDDPDTYPFQLLMTNDEPDLLRGFIDHRWRDRGLVLVSAEYRWPLLAAGYVNAPGVDAYLLTDAGQVFGRAEEISRRNMTVSFGGGLRLVTLRGFSGRVEVAASKEDTVFRLGAEQVFQYAKSGFYHGRNPVPVR